MNLNAEDIKDNNFPVLPAGEYDFTVEDAEHTTAKSGNQMWKVTLNVDNPDGNDVKVFDNLVEIQSCAWKFGEYFKSVGAFRDGMSTDDMPKTVGLIGKVQLIVEEDEQYGKRNKVRHYIYAKDEPKTDLAVKDDDDLPF